jgi:coenzyme F420-dependent glucose-6-phosphate dehydrogenase
MDSECGFVTRFGFSLSSEEHGALDLVRYARLAEAAGFSFAMISDHFHPWISRQGQSPFVWSVLGAIARETERLVVATGVTCPLIRTPPLIVAHAAATVATMMPGRFVLGVGTGENLNEHVTGERWPSITERRAMLEEAVGLIRELWNGELTDHEGRYYRVVDARLYSVPSEPPPIVVAAGGSRSGELAGRIGDGMVGVAPEREPVEAFERAGGAGKPRYGQLTVCWAEDEAQARRTAMEFWPQVALPGEASQELPLPRHFEQASKAASEDDVAEMIVCGPDVDAYLRQIDSFVDAGYDHLYFHQVGPDQRGFIAFAERELLPRFEREGMRAAG